MDQKVPFIFDRASFLDDWEVDLINREAECREREMEALENYHNLEADFAEREADFTRREAALGEREREALRCLHDAEARLVDEAREWRKVFLDQLPEAPSRD